MADYKMVDTTKLESDLTAIADAIREKSGSTDTLAFPEGFTEGIASISAAAAKEAEITITLASSKNTLEYWYNDDGVLKVMKIPYNTPTVVRRKLNETFTLMRYKTGYTEDAVTPTITVSGALCSDRICTGTKMDNSSFFGCGFYVLQPKLNRVTISVT